MAHAQSPRVQAANALSRAEFIDKYLSGEDPISTLNGYIITFETSASISPSMFEQCLRLVETTSRPAYEKSPDGWSTKKKRQEMREPDMRYLLVELAPDATENKLEASIGSSVATRHRNNVLQGFLSFMVTIEDYMEVAYCYEVHVQSWARGSGLGSKLLNILADIGSRVGVEKNMLTVFTSNEPAIRLYERLGYEWYDEEPVVPPKKLRGKSTPKPRPSYFIFARELSGIPSS